MSFTRRNFIAASGASLALAASASTDTADAAPAKPSQPTKSEDGPLFEISLAQWSLHRALFAKEIDNLDFAKQARETYDIGGLEYVNSFFKDKAKDKKYLREMIKRADDNGVESVLIMVDGEGRLGNPDKTGRLKAVSNHFKWVEAAKMLGCHSIRVNAASSGEYQEQVDYASDGLRRLSEFASKSGINVIVENHGGLSSNGQWLAQVIQKVGLDNCGTLPDFGNFKISNGKNGTPEVVYDRYLGMAALMPFAKAVSAKSHEFDADGNETRTDYMKVLQIVVDAGYRGYIGVEYEGGGKSEPDGIKATKALLEKCRMALS